jgi:hypothetical protein
MEFTEKAINRVDVVQIAKEALKPSKIELETIEKILTIVYGKAESVTWKQFASRLERLAKLERTPMHDTLCALCFVVGAEIGDGPN